MRICQYTTYEWEHIKQHVQECLLKLSINGSLVLTTYMTDAEEKKKHNWLIEFRIIYNVVISRTGPFLFLRQLHFIGYAFLLSTQGYI